jgi:DNA replication protein DnaC
MEGQDVNDIPPRDAWEPPPFDPVAFRIDQARDVLARRVPARFADAKADHPEVADWVRRFLTAPSQAPSLMLVGPTGTGKTWQCWGAVRAIVEGMAAEGRGLIWRATSHPDLNAALRPKADNSHSFALEPLVEAELLMLDDVGAGKQSDWTGDALYRLIDHRWAHSKPTIYSTNLTPAALTEMVGDRVVSRLGDAVHVALKGTDRRWADDR